MVAAWALIVGGLVRLVGEVAEMLAGHHTATSGALAGVGLIFAAAGLLGLWRDTRGSRPGRVGIVLVVLGAIGFSGIAAWSIGQGTLPLGTIARLPAFMMVASVTLVGAVALLGWLASSPAYPRWIGVVMSVSIALSLASSFVALPSLVQPVIDVVMALAFIQLGLSMRARRRQEGKTR